MGNTVEGLLRTLLRVIFDLEPPVEQDVGLPIRRPEGLEIPDRRWLEMVVEAIAAEVLLSFDLREKQADDDPIEVEQWQQPEVVDEWAERRRNHRLRIRTAVDDLFEGSLAQPEIPASLRAWKIQIADACADAILDRFHLRPASSGPHATCRRVMYDVGQELQRALGYKSLFLMTGRSAEVKAMEAAIERAYEAIRELTRLMQENR